MTYRCLSRRNFIFGLSILSMVLLGCLDAPMDNKLPSEIFKHWMHSREEDVEDVTFYRPSDYEFPPARGRRGFEIKENGEFIQYGIGPADGQQIKTGTWINSAENQIEVSFEAQSQKPYTMQIVSCHERLLKVRLNR